MEKKQSRTKILHIAQSAGGVAEYIKTFLNNVDRNKYENILVLSKDYKEQENELAKVCENIYYVDMIREINFSKDYKAIKEIRKIVKKENPNLVYLHSSKAGALGRIALIETKYKILYNAHGWYFNADIGKKALVYQIIEKLLSYRAQKIIAISKSEYNSAVEKRICNKKKIVLIENGIDTKKYNGFNEHREAMRHSYNIPKNAKVVGIVGRISEQKDPMTSIEAAAKIISINKDIYFIFVGAGELENKVKDYANKYKIQNNIIITGWVKDTKPYIEMFDIALLPSKWEGFGLAILEYMMCKKPIIATKIGGIADILNGSDMAFFMKKENSEDIVQNIEYIVNHEKEIEEIVENNYIQCKKRFSIEKEIETYDILFSELIKEGELYE